MDLQVSRDVPQEILDKINEVDWSSVPDVEKLCKQMKRGMKLLLLKEKRSGQTVTGSGGQRVMPDTPQCVLNVISTVDWGREDKVKIRRIAAQMGGQIAQKKLPYR